MEFVSLPETYQDPTKVKYHPLPIKFHSEYEQAIAAANVLHSWQHKGSMEGASYPKGYPGIRVIDLPQDPAYVPTLPVDYNLPYRLWQARKDRGELINPHEVVYGPSPIRLCINWPGYSDMYRTVNPRTDPITGAALPLTRKDLAIGIEALVMGLFRTNYNNKQHHGLIQKKLKPCAYYGTYFPIGAQDEDEWRIKIEDVILSEVTHVTKNVYHVKLCVPSRGRAEIRDTLQTIVNAKGKDRDMSSRDQ